MILFSSEWFLNQFSDYVKWQQELTEENLEHELHERQDKNIHYV